MKLRNKKTGEIIDLSEGFIRDTYNGERIQIKPFAISNKEGYVYGSLSELNEEWEDYEDERLYVISAEHKDGYICALKDDYKEFCAIAKELGIGFDTEEEAKKTVEKLKAWKRLRDKGFEFSHHSFLDRRISYKVPVADEKIGKDLNLLFGGEE